MLPGFTEVLSGGFQFLPSLLPRGLIPPTHSEPEVWLVGRGSPLGPGSGSQRPVVSQLPGRMLEWGQCAPPGISASPGQYPPWEGESPKSHLGLLCWLLRWGAGRLTARGRGWGLGVGTVVSPWGGARPRSCQLANREGQVIEKSNCAFLKHDFDQR